MLLRLSKLSMLKTRDIKFIGMSKTDPDDHFTSNLLNLNKKFYRISKNSMLNFIKHNRKIYKIKLLNYS